MIQHQIDLPIPVLNEPKPKSMAAVKPEGLLVGLIQWVASPRTLNVGSVRGIVVRRAA